MKNLFNRSRAANTRFIWNEIPGSGEVVTETPDVKELVSEVDKFIEDYLELSDEQKVQVKADILALVGEDGEIADKEIKDIEKALVELLPLGSTVDMKIKRASSVRSEALPGVKDADPDKYLELTKPFPDDVLDYMTANPKYYLTGEGKIMVGGQEVDDYPEGLDRNKLKGMKRVENDFKNLDVDSAEELYEVIQGTYGRENAAVTDRDFTMGMAEDLYSYHTEGKSTQEGSGKYELDTENTDKEPISSEVHYLQELLGKANAVLRGSLMKNSVAEGGADGQDGFATIETRRQFCADINKAKYDVVKYKNVTERSTDIEVKVKEREPFKEVLLKNPGRTVIMGDYSGSMKADIENMSAEVQAAIKENPDLDIAFFQIEGGDREVAFASGAKKIPVMFDKNAKGNKMIIYSDELQSDSYEDVSKFVDLCKEYNVEAHYYFIDPKTPGQMKTVNLAGMSAEEMMKFTKVGVTQNQADKGTYDEVGDETFAMKKPDNEASPEFPKLVSQTKRLSLHLDYALQSENSGDKNEFGVNMINVWRSLSVIEENGMPGKEAFLKNFEVPFKQLLEGEFGDNEKLRDNYSTLQKMISGKMLVASR